MKTEKKQEKLLNVIGDIDDELIYDAAGDVRKRTGWMKWGSLAAAVLVLCAGIWLFESGILNLRTEDSGSLSDINYSSADVPEIPSQTDTTPETAPSDNYQEADSIVILDVNPSIALTVNSEERVVNAEGLNEDGNIVLEEMDLTGVDITVAVNAVVGSMLQKGYLSDLQNAILVSVENDDTEKSAALQERVSSIIGSALQNGNLEGSVLSQTLDDTADLEQIAREYNISLGKAALIQEVMAQDMTLTAEKLAPLSITEIALISQSKNLSSQTLTQNGTASDKAYITREAAILAAYDYAGVNENDAAGVRAEFDSDDGIMVYEVEFRIGTVEYELDIDARTGQLVKYETENKGTANPGGNSSQQPSGEYIGEAAAREAALKDAGISADTVKYINAWLDYDDGRPEHYEVEFAVGSVQYKYEIDLYNGSVLSKEAENNGSQDGHEHSGTNDSSANIGADAAKTTALTHAGLTESQVTKLKAEYENDHGSALYEVEFKYNGFEYEYRIDAITGEILSQWTENNGNYSGSSSDIGQEAAKTAALTHAGFTESQVRKLKVDYDYDNGIAIYEIEFEYNQYEYEYEIDAATGTILKYEIDD